MVWRGGVGCGGKGGLLFVQEIKSDVLRRIQEYAATAPIGHADARKYEEFKAMMSN
jgi:hypothetical protein